MCGITGLFAFNETGRFNLINLAQATACLSNRGPDDEGMFLDERVGLGHRRLAVIDLSGNAAQPMTDESGRFTIVYNGEIYNYRQLRQQLANKGYAFRSSSDTEAALKMYMWKGSDCLNDFNGFFAFAIYDRREHELFIARDRFGLKPLYYYLDEDKLIFASEMKSILAYGIPKALDAASLMHYLQLNYIPAPYTILQGVRKLSPGHWLKVKDRKVIVERYYRLPYSENEINPEKLSYERQQEAVKRLLEESVKDRLVSDVPLGSFLSGGTDSSIIAAIARRHTDHLDTFSIGYRDEPYFDETHYAELVARHINARHTVFKLTNDDLYQELFDILDYLDEPFADSSAIPTYVLSKRTRKAATVALSGDGADEVFSGYHKHSAMYRASRQSTLNALIKTLGPLWKILPGSRNNYLFNKFRQLERYAGGLNLDQKERYWRWAVLCERPEAVDRLSDEVLNRLDFETEERRRLGYISNLNGSEDFNQALYADMHLVLPNDMLAKVDMMSMANGLEVRAPFLDYRLVEFVFKLPVSSKIQPNIRKRILQDAFRDTLPPQLYNRPKRGFETPLLKWFRKDLKSLIENELLQDDFIESQKIFNPSNVRNLKKQLYSVNPGDAAAHIWALIVFQWWWKKYFSL